MSTEEIIAFRLGKSRNTRQQLEIISNCGQSKRIDQRQSTHSLQTTEIQTRRSIMKLHHSTDISVNRTRSIKTLFVSTFSSRLLLLLFFLLLLVLSGQTAKECSKKKPTLSFLFNSLNTEILSFSDTRFCSSGDSCQRMSSILR